MGSTVKAYTYEKYGNPDVLELSDLPKPSPKPNEVLVRLEALSVNPAEWHYLRAETLLVRLMAGLRGPRNKLLGGDFAGFVEAVGDKVTLFKVGDEVFGRSDFGGFAEYVTVTKNRLAIKPSNLSFDEAAAMPLAALTALQALQKAGLKANQRVLINGASGGIGTLAVQLAKASGSHVTGVCSTKNTELVYSLGADEVVDYAQESIVHSGKQFDIIIDAVGNLNVSDLKKLLSPKGNAVVLGFEKVSTLFQVMIQGPLSSLVSSQSIALIDAKTTRQYLDSIRQSIEKGDLKPVIDKRYTFSELPNALSYLGTKRARGKLVVSL